MLRIGIDCHKLEDADGANRAGVGRHTYRLLEELSRQPHLAKRFRFYLYFKGSVPQNIQFLKNSLFVPKVAKLPLFFPFFRPSFNSYFHLALPLYAVKDRVNVTFFPSFMLPALFVKKSLVLLTNDIYYEFTQGTLPLRYRLGYRLFANWAARRATQITTQTNASRRDISRQFNLDSQKIAVIPLGADFQLSKGGGGEKKSYILYVGQAFPRRHLKETIEAFSLIAKEFPQYSLIALGKDKYTPPCIDALARRVNRELGEERVIRMQSVSDEELKKLYARAQLFAYISSHEAMGLPPLEALALGTPSVLADTPTTREIFGTNAFFVNTPYSATAIAAVLRNALTNAEERARIVADSSTVLNRYTWERHTAAMVRLFEKTAAA